MAEAVGAVGTSTDDQIQELLKEQIDRQLQDDATKRAAAAAASSTGVLASPEAVSASSSDKTNTTGYAIATPGPADTLAKLQNGEKRAAEVKGTEGGGIHPHKEGPAAAMAKAGGHRGGGHGGVKSDDDDLNDPNNPANWDNPSSFYYKGGDQDSPAVRVSSVTPADFSGPQKA